MKIDLIISSLTSGGAERVVSLLANKFVDRGHEVRLFTFSPIDDAYELDSRIKRIKYEKKFLIFNFTSVKCLFVLLWYYRKKNNRPDIISSHMTLMGYATIPISKLYNIKIIISEHSNHFRGKNSINNWLLWKYLYKLPDAITVLTNYDLPFFQKINKNTIVIHNPCSFEPLQYIHNKREKVILAVGNVNRYKVKGFDNLLEVVGKVLPEHPEWKLKIIGTGDEGLSFLKEMALNLKIIDQVEFMGYRSDVKHQMYNSDIFILSSRFEGLPMGLLEAMSQGMTCIAYDCISGPSEIIKNGINGILVDNQNKQKLAEALKMVIGNNELRVYLRQNAIDSLGKFSIENIALEWENLINDICGTNNIK